MQIEALIQQANVIARDVTAQEAIAADSNGTWVYNTMNALMDTKLTGLLIPKTLHGQGQGMYALVRICEELGKAYSSAGLCFGMHCVGSAVLAAKATGWQQDHYLVPIAEGKHVTTLALSESGTGAHFYFPQTPLIAVTDNEFVVNGTKTFVTNGTHAHSYVISTLGASAEADADHFSCVVVDSTADGISWGKEWDGLGMRGNSSRELKLDNVHISGKHILGEKGDQLWYIFNIVAPYFLMAMAGTYLGIAEAALLEAKTTLAKRTYAHNGTSLSQVALLQHRLGTLWAKVERTRQLIYYAAKAGDNNETGSLLAVLSAKAEVGGCVVDIVNEAMTLAGGLGYKNNSHLGMLLRDARAAHVMAPTTDLLYTWIGRLMLDQPLLLD